MQNTAVIKPTYEELEAKVHLLEFELNKLRRLIFGQKSERYVPVVDASQMNIPLENEQLLEQKSPETEQISYTRTKKDKKQTPHGRKPLPAHLPRKDIVIEPDEDVSSLKKIGEQITEELEYEPAKFYVNRYIRPKYALEQDEGVIIANLPTRPIEKGIAGPGLLAHVLVSKFVDHLPLYRQRQQSGKD